MRTKGLGTILICVLLVVGIIYSNQRQQEVEEMSPDIFINAISYEFPFFLQEGKSVIKIGTIKSFENGWHVVTIRSIREASEPVPVFVVLNELNNKLRVVLGPDTYFSETELLRHNIPDSVILGLQEL